MPFVSPTRKDYGDTLTSPGIAQPKMTMNIDAYGVAQAQAVWALDSANVNITAAVNAYNLGREYPDNFGFPMKSYKYSYAFDKGGVCMLTVDYMGIARASGYSDSQITGISTCSSQPIETHPNFTKITKQGIGNVIGGTPNNPANQAIFKQVEGTAQYTFGGFGVALDAAGNPNPKAGIKQYLRPTINIRGTIFISYAMRNIATNLLNSVGCIVSGPSDMQKLVKPLVITDSDKCIIASANYECIGNPYGEYAAVKMTYDIMCSQDGIGWDTDIYQKKGSIF